jgi:hypothetical protein
VGQSRLGTPSDLTECTHAELRALRIWILMRRPVYVSDGEDRQFSVAAHGGSAPNAYSLVGPCGDAAALPGIAALPGSTDAVLSLAISPDGPLAAGFCRCGLPAAS